MAYRTGSPRPPVGVNHLQQDAMTRRDYPRYGFNGGGQDFLDSRRLQRERAIVNVWPPSPKEPARELSSLQTKSKSKKISKRPRSSETSTSSDSEDERRRRERKEHKRARKAREKGHRKRSRSRDREESGDERYPRSSQRHRSRPSRSPIRSSSSSRRRTRSTSGSPRRMEIDTNARGPPANLSTQSREISTGSPPSSEAAHDSDDGIGPVPMHAPKGNRRVDERAYGGSLLRGEGSAMAAFLQDGTDLRIPRRGEIGLSSDQIAAFEDVGYVMSGSRHRRMNAVRMRKENQVISAEEKRSILKLQKEERERREAILREEFSELVSEKLKASAAAVGTVPSAPEK